MTASLDLFKNPAYRKRAEEIQQEFGQPQTNGHSLYEELKQLITMQGEWNYEQQVRDFPHGMAIPLLGGATDLSKEMDQWLGDQVGRDNYVAFPECIGKYKERWNWIHFRTADQAILFKLTWV